MFFDPLGPLRGMIVGTLMLMLFALVAIAMLVKLILCAVGIVIAVRVVRWLRKAE